MTLFETKNIKRKNHMNEKLALFYLTLIALFLATLQYLCGVSLTICAGFSVIFVIVSGLIYDKIKISPHHLASDILKVYAFSYLVYALFLVVYANNLVFILFVIMACSILFASYNHD